METNTTLCTSLISHQQILRDAKSKALPKQRSTETQRQVACLTTKGPTPSGFLYLFPCPSGLARKFPSNHPHGGCGFFSSLPHTRHARSLESMKLNQENKHFKEKVNPNIPPYFGLFHLFM
jgi:hypothetical protein